MAWGVLLAAVACTDLSGLSGPEEEDAGTPTTPKKDGGAGSDAGNDVGASPPEGRCDPLLPFAAPELMTAFDPTDNFVKGAILSPDQLEVFYLRYKGSEWDLRHARRATRTDPWGVVETMPATPSPDGALSLTAAGLKLYYWTIDSNYRATRASTGSSFGTPAVFDVASAPMPFVVAADDMAYFSKIEGDGASDRVLKRGSVTTFGFSSGAVTVPIPHVPGTRDDRPILNTRETVMYFTSDRPGGKGLADVWVSRRASKSDELGAPAHVPELSTDEPDSVTWVSDDECEVFLDRASHVYVARRPK